MTLGGQNNSVRGRANVPDLVWHAGAWAIYIGYEIGTIYLFTGRTGRPGSYMVFYLLNITLFYVHALLALPLAARAKHHRIVTALVLLTAEMTLYLSIKCVLDLLTDHWNDISHEEFRYARRYFGANLWRGLYFCGTSSVYWAVRRSVEARLAQAATARDLAEMHNAYLQQQLRPHLLFNMLNMIYGAFRPVSERAAQCVATLADVMRYTYTPSGPGGLVPLNEEIGQICNLIELHRLRFDAYLHFDLELTGPVHDHDVPRLLLMTLTENIFQHGDLTDEDHPASLDIMVMDDGRIIYHSKNLKGPWQRPPGSEPAGLRDLVKRLDHAYPGRYLLEINDRPRSFELKLTLLC